MNEELISKLISIVEKTSPELWRIALQQVEVQAAQSIFGMVAFLILAILGIFGAIIGTKRVSEGDYIYLMVFGYAGIAIGATMLLVNLSNYISYQINPEYYAIQVLMELVK